MNNKIVSVVVIVVVVLGVVWYVYFKNNTKQEVLPAGETGQIQNNQEIPKLPEIPKFILGSVLRVEGQNIFVTVGNEEKTIITDGKTVLISQVKDEQGYKNIPATFSDIKISSQIIVYYSQNSGSQYTADKIQMLNF